MFRSRPRLGHDGRRSYLGNFDICAYALATWDWINAAIKPPLDIGIVKTSHRISTQERRHRTWVDAAVFVKGAIQ